ncbi:hypothetical protein AX15_006925 [Amanita polypyramis BW_CC]|nr:hypothetical protein AX15_006925 [Amanita polypyramis BW_CC]
MSGQYLNVITENASRLGMRIQESISEHTRDLGIARGSALYLDVPDDKNIRRQLESSSDREKLDALKRLIALISKGRNISEYFAQVVKNVASQNLEIRKLVYIYLLRYAEQEPDLALLSINTFQKDLNDSNPYIRAMALRVLGGIKVPMIGNIVVLAIKKSAADVSPYVRKSAALAIPKCYSLDANHLPALISVITILLRDRSPLSIGSVAVAFEAVCPTRLDLLHQHYRRLCRTLLDVDEWGQVDLMNLLLRYARTMLPRPIINAASLDIDSDVELLLSSAEPLLHSRNPAVVLAAARILYYAGPSSYIQKAVQPLLRLMNQSREVERVVLVYLLTISRTHREPFIPYYSRFFIRRDDISQVKRDKLQLLMNLLTVENSQAIIHELIEYTNDTDDDVVLESTMSIGKCAQVIPECAQQCLSALIEMIKSPYDAVVSNAVVVLKTLLQAQMSVSHAPAATQIVRRLAQSIDIIRHENARVCVLWLVGQYAECHDATPGPPGIAEWAPDVLRKMAKSFNGETSAIKLQVVVLASKLLVLSPGDQRLQLLARYVLNVARYDKNYDVRDRARMMASLLSGIIPDLSNGIDTEERGGVVLRREQVKVILFDGKSNMVEVGPRQKTNDNFIIGSLSGVTGKSMLSDSVLPDWLERGVESSLRDSEEDAAPVQSVKMGNTDPVVLTPTSGPRPDSTNGTSKGPWTDLDEFYADTEDEAQAPETEDVEEENDEDTDAESETETGPESDDDDSSSEVDSSGDK